MAAFEYGYPPFNRTAPSRMENAEKPSKWDKLKPWRRSQRKKKPRDKTPLGAEAPPMYRNGPTKLNPFALSSSPNPFAMGVFPGYAMHRSPDDMFRQDRNFNPRGAISDISPVSKPKEKDPPGIFEPPPYKTARPPLSNIFTMFEPPVEEQRGSTSSKERFLESPKVTPVSSTKQLTSSSENTSLSNLHGKRRHSTPGPVFTPNNLRPIRSSDQSVHSDTSLERQRRRVRRNEAIRALPSVPRRDHHIIPEEKEIDSPILELKAPPLRSQQHSRVPDYSSHGTDTTDGGRVVAMETAGGISSNRHNQSRNRPARPKQQQTPPVAAAPVAVGREMLELEHELNVEDPPYEPQPPVHVARERPRRDRYEHHFYEPPPPSAPLMSEDVKRPAKVSRKKSKKVKSKEKAGLKMPVKLDKSTGANATAGNGGDDEIKGFDAFMMY